MPETTQSLTSSNATVGTVSPTYTEGPITRTDIVRYAGASGDFNPIHHDETFARAAGLPGVFAMGMMQGGMLSRLASDWLGLSNIRKFKIRFQAQVWPGDVLTMQGEITAVRQMDAGVEVDAALTAKRQTEEVALQAFATALLQKVR